MSWGDLLWVGLGWVVCFYVGHMQGWKAGFRASQAIYVRCLTDMTQSVERAVKIAVGREG